VCFSALVIVFLFLADCTNGHAIGAVLRPSVVICRP